MKPQKDVELELMECRGTQISCIAAKSLAEPLEACRPQESLNSETPKHPEVHGRAISRAPHREAFIPYTKILSVQRRQVGLQKHIDLGRSSIQGGQLGWQSCRHTNVSRDLSIKARRPRGGHFGAQTAKIATNHPAEPWH
jgi:hypothetical protein